MFDLISHSLQKRKAQNRAAQRAFRERKEKHLKDLENKVDDLQKESEATNHENGLLRAQVERLQVELKEYRKRLSWISSNGMNRQQSVSNQQRNTTVANNNDFSFQFPKFGDLPVTNLFGTSGQKQNGQSGPQQNQRTSSLPVNSSASPAQATAARNSISNGSQRGQQSRTTSMSNSPMTNNYSASPGSYSSPEQQNTMDSLTGLFSPSILEATKNSPLGYFPVNNSNQNNGAARGSFDNGYSPAQVYNTSSVSNTESPGSSSESHQQSSSSIGTSPDPTFNSPNHKTMEFSGLNTISEENANNIWTGKATTF